MVTIYSQHEFEYLHLLAPQARIKYIKIYNYLCLKKKKKKNIYLKAPRVIANNGLSLYICECHSWDLKMYYNLLALHYF